MIVPDHRPEEPQVQTETRQEGANTDPGPRVLRAGLTANRRTTTGGDGRLLHVIQHLFPIILLEGPRLRPTMIELAWQGQDLARHHINPQLNTIRRILRIMEKDQYQLSLCEIEI